MDAAVIEQSKYLVAGAFHIVMHMGLTAVDVNDDPVDAGFDNGIQKSPSIGRQKGNAIRKKLTPQPLLLHIADNGNEVGVQCWLTTDEGNALEITLLPGKVDFMPHLVQALRFTPGSGVAGFAGDIAGAGDLYRQMGVIAPLVRERFEYRAIVQLAGSHRLSRNSGETGRAVTDLISLPRRRRLIRFRLAQRIGNIVSTCHSDNTICNRNILVPLNQIVTLESRLLFSCIQIGAFFSGFHFGPVNSEDSFVS